MEMFPRPLLYYFITIKCHYNKDKFPTTVTSKKYTVRTEK
jgi:hypothetical protein